MLELRTIQQPSFLFFLRRNYAKVLVSTEAEPCSSIESTGLDLSQQVLESLFKISQSPEYAPNTMGLEESCKEIVVTGSPI